MLTLGRALAMKPKMLMVDELSVGLAPLIVDRLFDALIATAHEDGTAVLLVEQQARRALRVADRWYLLSRGVLAAKGDASDSDELWESYVS
jgi:branched-chain amino acid transport system ATP-binding protein